MMAFQPNSALLLDVAFLCACSAYNVPAAPRNANGMHNATRLTRVQCTNDYGCTLSGTCMRGRCVCDKPWWGDHCERLRLKPAPLPAPFVPKRAPNHFTWGAAPFLAADGTGRSCMYFTWLVGWQDGNDTRTVPYSDTVSGSLGLACSQDVTGPYTVVEPVAFPFRPGHFDAAYLENVVLTYSPHDHGYLMAYTTSPPNVARNTLNWEGNGGNVSGLQYMGLAFTKDLLNGPWARLNRTILAPREGGFERGVAINPAVLAYPNGTVVVTYRGTHDDGYGNCIAAAWDAPCVRPPGTPCHATFDPQHFVLWSTFSVLWGSFTSQVAIAVKH